VSGKILNDTVTGRDTAITNIIVSRKGTHKHAYAERRLIKAMAEDQR
jgi:hypothetical protein